MRRHCLFPKESNERGVGDKDASLLQLWMRRRLSIQQHVATRRHITLFWDLARKCSSSSLSSSFSCSPRLQQLQYIEFFQLVGKALIDGISNDAATALAQRDWLYDAEGRSCLDYEGFREALFIIAELLLPLESDASMFASFFLELREAIAVPDVQGRTDEMPTASELHEANVFIKRELQDVSKIRGAFLQQIPQHLEASQAILDLPLPNLQTMSLKQFLLALNPRKFSMSRKFSALFNNNQSEPEAQEPSSQATRRSNPIKVPSQLLNKDSTDEWEIEDATLNRMVEFPPLVIAVLGPPCCGKTRVAKKLANVLELSYFSVASVIERAFERWTKHETENASSETSNDSETKPAIADENESPALLSPAERTDLFNGLALPKDTALRLLTVELTKAKEAGQGIVLDGIRPSEIPSIAFDYVVNLECSEEDARRVAQGLRMCGSSRLLYSAREHQMAIPNGDLEQNGFASDLYVFPPVVSPPAKKPDAESAANDDDSKPPDAEGDETPAEAEPEGSEEPMRSVDLAKEARTNLLLQNEIVVPLETTFSACSWFLQHFDERFKEYRQLSESSIAPAATTPYPIHLLSTQSLASLIDQCVFEITGNSDGIARSMRVQNPVPLRLPADIASSTRPEQIRWILYGDLTDELAENDKKAILPTETRWLSRWKEFCPVTSTPGQLILGSPEFAVVFASRVYFMASSSARDKFCATPLTFARGKPSPRSYSRILLASSINLAPFARELHALLGLPVFDTNEVLTLACSQSVISCFENQCVLPATASKLVAEAIHLAATRMEKTISEGSEWILCDLIPVPAAVEALKEHNCLPEIIIFLTPEHQLIQQLSQTGGELPTLKLQSLTTMATSTALLELAAANQIDVKTGNLYVNTDDTMAEIRRLLNPIDPNRVDREEDGYLQPDQGLNAFKAENPIVRKKAFGETLLYCPVSWHDKRVLVPGASEFISAYRQKFYSFVGQEQKSAFDRNPIKYLPSDSRTSSFSPLVLFLGVRGTDRQTLATSLSKAEGFDHLLLTEVDKMIAMRQTIETMKKAPKDMKEVYAEELRNHLMAVGSGSKTPRVLLLAGFGLEPSRIPDGDLIQLCCDLHVVPTLVIPLTISEEEAMRRGIQKWKEALPKYKINRVVVDNEAEENVEEDISTEEAEAKEMERLKEAYEADKEAIEQALEVFSGRNVPVAPEVNVSGSIRQSVKLLRNLLHEYTSKKANMFDFCEVVPMTRARELLRAGAVIVGKHGKNCPVTSDTFLGESGQSNAVVFRNRLYFPATVNAMDKFCSNPTLFIARTSAPPIYQPSCCIVGPPKCGKTQLAQALAREFQFIYVSPSNAIEWVTQTQGNSALYHQIKDQPSVQDPALVYEALRRRLMSADCQKHGWVLDGYLLRSHELNQLKAAHFDGVESTVLVVLDGNLFPILTREQHRIHQTPPEQRSEANLQDKIIQEMASWNAHRFDLLDVLTTRYGSSYVKQVDLRVSVWNAYAEIRRLVCESVHTLQRFYQRIARGQAASLEGITIATADMEPLMHPLVKTFCPVELVNDKYSCCEVWQREHVVFYDGWCFWLANEENSNAFLQNPGRWLLPLLMETTDLQAEPRVARFLSKTPLEASLLSLMSVADCDFPEFKGYCTVTFKHGKGPKDWTALVKGIVFYRVCYENRVYFFASEDKKRQFMSQPTTFSRQTLPIKLPPVVTNKVLNKLPGKLEQELSAVLNASLLALGAERPKFPFVDCTRSALFYVALHLKTCTKGLAPHVRAKYEKRKLAFEQDCRLGEFLKTATSAGGVALNGVRAVKGSIEDLETKMTRFDEIVKSTDRWRCFIEYSNVPNGS